MMDGVKIESERYRPNQRQKTSVEKYSRSKTPLTEVDSPINPTASKKLGALQEAYQVESPHHAKA